MNIFDILYTILIGPLKLLFEIIFSISYYVTGSPGLAIIALSLVMNILLLPLYNRADKIQEEENQIQARMKDGVDHIKKAFKGDEQYFILNTYYRQNGYKPIYALRNSISLLLEIPFFIAAYDFLSNLQLLNVSSFGVIGNLGAPDGLLGGINLLPILMTLINILSSIIYTKGRPFRDNIQLYVLAILFLILLYDRPSGLVLYWTLNNLFSLGKNVVAKLISVPVRKTGKEKIDFFAGFDFKAFFTGCLCLLVITGIAIPLSVIHSSPSEFVDKTLLYNPLHYVFSAAQLAAGTFIVWFCVYYFLVDKRTKSFFAFLSVALSLVFICDYVFFGHDLGSISNRLIYDGDMIFSLKELAINLLIVVAIILLCYLFKKISTQLVTIVLVSCLALSVLYGAEVYREGNNTITDLREMKKELGGFNISFSKNGKNVVILMLDRAINSYFPFLLAEKPELQEQFKGFTYYPNTLSYGGYTIFGAPAVFGGYEYTPEMINKRDKELLVDKHNESEKIMPTIFEENGYDVTLCDPSLAGYQWIPDLSVFDDIPDLKTFNTEGAFHLNGFEEFTSLNSLNRNLFVFSLTKGIPLILESKLYNSGFYHDLDYYLSSRNLTPEFVESYAVLCNLSERTSFNDNNGNVLIMSNDTTHSPAMLQEPDYTPSLSVDNDEYNREHKVRYSIEGKELSLETDDQYRHYMVNMATMLKLGEWFDFLREKDVYDNTRIILVSDHGRPIHQFSEYALEEYEDDIMRYNPILLVKDFDAQEFTIDYSFMTNADVPTLAMDKLIDNPINPFTRKPIDGSQKSGKHYVLYSENFGFEDNTKTQFVPRRWYVLENQNVLLPDNWTKTQDPNSK